MFLVKRKDGSFIPATREDQEKANKVSVGEEVKAKMARNSRFHRKMMALFRLGYDNWKPEIKATKWGLPEKSFTRFRKDMLILAGHYELTITIKNEPKVEAVSLSFESMNEDKFQDVYDDVLLEVSKLLDSAPEVIQSELAGFYS